MGGTRLTNKTTQAKHVLRHTLRQQRRAIINRHERSTRIGTHITRMPHYQAAHIIHCYLPIGSEVDTTPLITHALSHQKRIIVPVVQQDTSDLAHTWLTSLEAEDLHAGVYGIPQPSLIQPLTLSPDTCDLIIVPLLGFDSAGYRLGYGKGYYDRFLTVMTAPAVGIAFAAQQVAAIPREPHDVPLCCIVTENGPIGGG